MSLPVDNPRPSPDAQVRKVKVSIGCCPSTPFTYCTRLCSTRIFNPCLAKSSYATARTLRGGGPALRRRVTSSLPERLRLATRFHSALPCCRRRAQQLSDFSVRAALIALGYLAIFGMRTILSALFLPEQIITYSGSSPRINRFSPS